MLNYAQFSNNAKNLVDRLADSYSKQASFFSTFTACFSQFYITSSMDDAALISLMAETLSNVEDMNLFLFARDDTNYPITEINELNEYKKQILIGIYLKVWSKHKYSLLSFTKSHFAKLLESDLDITKLNLGVEVINNAIDALSQYISYIFSNKDDNESYKKLVEQLGVAIQAELILLKKTLCAEVTSPKNSTSKIWSQSYEINNSEQNLAVFKAYMLGKDFYSTITKSPKNQTDFFKYIKKCTFTSKDMLNLIQSVTDGKVRTLLIILLLSKKNFYNNLDGESILTRLTSDEYVPSRLNALVHQMDLSVLSLDLIKELQPEAAVSLLFSVPHFHLFEESTVKALLDKLSGYPVIQYWLKHFYAAPNAHYVLALFIKLQNTLISIELKELPILPKTTLCAKAMQHLELFDAVDANHELFNLKDIESNLNLSIQYFLNGHTDNCYANYINATFKRLINLQHQFSLKTITLLTNLIGRQQFKDLNANSSYLIQFLKYYKEEPEGVTLLIYQYLTLFSNKASFECDRAGIHAICPLLNDRTIDLTIRNSLFKGFLSFPELFDDEIYTNLFQFDAKSLLQYFGMQGGEENYKRVITLCKWAQQHPKVIKNDCVLLMIKQALFEAESELHFFKNKGFVATFFRRFVRCWIYGWTGFFNPNLPQYVALSNLDNPPNAELIMGTSSLSKLATEYELDQKISFLLADMRLEYNGHDLKELCIALNNYSFKVNPQDEYKLRNDIDMLYSGFKKNTYLTQDSDYIEYQEVFIHNRLRLLELQLCAGKKDELIKLIEQIDESDVRLQAIKKELDSVLPKFKDEESQENTESISTANASSQYQSDEVKQNQIVGPNLNTFFRKSSTVSSASMLTMQPM